MSVKITQFEAENVKRVKAVTLTPAADGLTVIGGRNNQGKTSVLDALAWALGGDRYRPSAAQRDESVIPPRLRVKLSNGIVVERSGKNSDLKVIDETGHRAGQQLLNTFVEQLAVDMPRFMAATDKEKADTLLRVIGLEDQVNALEKQEAELYDQRRAVGQIADQKAKYAKELPNYPEAPNEPVSAMELIQRQQDILAQNGENQRKRLRASELAAQVEQLDRQLKEIQDRLAAAKADLEIAQKDALDLEDESTDQLERDIRNIEEINTKVRTNQDKLRAEAEAKDYQDKYDTLTAQIEVVRKEKRDLLLGAALPLPGLSVDNGVLTYQDKPWDCMSGSEQMKVAAAIVRALKPQCGFILMDKLEQMDADTLREFGAWMEAEGLQGIATRVSTGGECTIIIEDGEAVAVDTTGNTEDQPGDSPWKEGF